MGRVAEWEADPYTFADDPANTRDWVPESSFYGYDSVYDSRNVGYKGPNFSYATMPDQYTMNFIRQHELTKPGQSFGECVVDARLHVEAVRGGAGFAGVAHLGDHRAIERDIEIGVVENDERRISSQFHRA